MKYFDPYYGGEGLDISTSPASLAGDPLSSGKSEPSTVIGFGDNGEEDDEDKKTYESFDEVLKMSKEQEDNLDALLSEYTSSAEDEDFITLIKNIIV